MYQHTNLDNVLISALRKIDFANQMAPRPKLVTLLLTEFNINIETATDEQKQQLIKDLKERGKHVLDWYKKGGLRHQTKTTITPELNPPPELSKLTITTK